MEKTVNESIAGGVWLFLGSLVNNVLGLVFWLVITYMSGVGSIGEASAIVSAATIALTLVSGGLNIAVVRQVAAEGAEAIGASLLVSLILAFVAIMLTVPLTYFLGTIHVLVYLASLYAGLNILLITFLSILLGLTLFKQYFETVSIGALAKLTVGALLALLEVGVLAPLAGFMAYVVAGLIVAVLLVMIYHRHKISLKTKSEQIKDLVKLTYSNYPYIIANQLLTVLSVYVFAIIIGEEVQTGILYISLMIMLAILAVPGSIIGAALPIGTRSNTDPFPESFRIGLSLATPIIVLTIPFTKPILQIINPNLVSGASALEVLLLSIAPLTALTTIINKLNKEGKTRNIAVIGSIRLITLLILLYFLARSMGVYGAAISFLLSNTVALIIALREEVRILKTLIILWILHILTAILMITSIPGIIVAVLMTTISIITLQYTKTYTLKDLKNTISIVRKTLL